MDLLGSASFVLRNLDVTQSNKAQDMRALASGLRVQSAADDPSGLAISQTIQAKVDGLQQSVQNVQDANNAMNLAQSTLGQVTTVLQRIRTLIVNARSDLNSANDLQNIQTEIQQLLQEINTISSRVTFNGLQLFSGQFDTSQGTAASIVQIPSPILNPDGSVPSPTITNADGLGNPGPLLSNPQLIAGNFQAGIVVVQSAPSSNPVDDVLGPLGGPGTQYVINTYSNSNNGNGLQFVNNTNIPYGSGQLPGTAFPTAIGALPAINTITLSNTSANDPQAAIAFITTNATQAAGGQALSVNDGGQEGTTVSIALPTINTTALGVSGISVLAPQVENIFGVVTGQSSSNILAAVDAEYRVDAALQQVSAAEATIGAQTVALSSDASNDQITILNETAAISAIRDTNVGQTVTNLTLQNLTQSAGNAVLAQLHVNQERITAMLFK